MYKINMYKCHLKLSFGYGRKHVDYLKLVYLNKQTYPSQLYIIKKKMSSV